MFYKFVCKDEVFNLLCARLFLCNRLKFLRGLYVCIPVLYKHAAK